MDENKIFDLLEKIYTQVQDNSKRLDNIENRIEKIGDEVKKANMVKIDELILSHKSMLDGCKDNAEHIAMIDDKIDRLQIDVNTISAKVYDNNSRIIRISNKLKNYDKNGF
jgi:outer membrane murein-binding lipoprotein Lpp